MIGSSTNFFIKPGYICREQANYFVDDTGDKTNQPEVYPFAAGVAVSCKVKTIVDIGCGRAVKLAKLHQQCSDWDFIGVDHGENIRWCQQHHSFGAWLERDLETIDVEDSFGLEWYTANIIICSDVIEHLVNPLPLLRTLRSSLDDGCVYAILSTPERDLTHGPEHMGPPVNLCHTREWNLTEFKALLRTSGLSIDHIGLTLTDDRGFGNKTILAVVRAS